MKNNAITAVQIEIQNENRENRKIQRTNSLLFADQIEKVEILSGEERGNGKRRFARMLRLVLDAGIEAIGQMQGEV
jgi:hypothetical protein